MSDKPGVVVVGGGITGLAAAAWLADRLTPNADGGRPDRVTVLEAAPRLGGKIATEPFAGIPLDTGPDAFLARTRTASDLCRAVGLGDELVSPGTGTAYVWTRGRLRRLPEGLVLGVPTNLWALARTGILSPGGLARVCLDLALPPTRRAEGDRSVGDLVRSRLGEEANRRLVDPLLGGINGGCSDQLSLAVAAPQLAAAATHRSLIRGASAIRHEGNEDAPTAAPVFLTVRGGLGRLVDALGSSLAERSRVEVCLGEGAARLHREAGWWAVTTSRGRRLRAAAVILATPAPATADLLAVASPSAAAVLRGIAHASVALVTIAYPTAALNRPLQGSGFLVPRIERRLMTACSWVNSKWPHLDQRDTLVLRVSAGRAGDERALELDDKTLVRRLHEELTQAMGMGAGPLEARVHRFPNAFPQFAVGHADRVVAVEATLAAEAPGVVVAGAAYRGVGLPTCIAEGQTAARRALTHAQGTAEDDLLKPGETARST